MKQKASPIKILALFLITILHLSCANKSPAETTVKAVPPTEVTQKKAIQKTAVQLKYKTAIRAIFEDSKGNLWFGSHKEGVCFYDGKEVHYFTTEDGLSENQVRTIQEDAQGKIWFGTSEGVSSYDGKSITNHQRQYDLFGNQTKIEGKWALSQNDLWFNAGNESGVYRMQNEVLSFLPFPLQGDTESFNIYGVTGISRPNKDRLWIATYAAVFAYDAHSIETIDNPSLGFLKEENGLHVRSILEDSKGRLWIGNNGIGVLLKEENTISNFSEKMGLLPSNGLIGGSLSPPGTLEHVFSIGEDSAGNIWFGDRDTGAWKYDGKLMKNYTRKDGLTSTHIWQIYETKNGDLLFAMEDGRVCGFNGVGFEVVY